MNLDFDILSFIKLVQNLVSTAAERTHLCCCFTRRRGFASLFSIIMHGLLLLVLHSYIYTHTRQKNKKKQLHAKV